MIALGFVFYMDQTVPLMRVTDTPNEIERWYFIPIIFIGLLFFAMNKKFRRFGVGLTALFIYGLLFLTNPIYPYHRGQMFMVTEKYDQALSDFIMASLLTYQQLDTNTIDVIINIDLNVSMQELFNKIGNKDYDGVSDYLVNLNTLDELDTYWRHIVFCLEKVKEQ